MFSRLPLPDSHPGLKQASLIAHVTAARSRAEQSLAHPASVDSLPTRRTRVPTSLLATFAAVGCSRWSPRRRNPRHRMACRRRGIDFLRPLQSSPSLEQAHALLRAESPRVDEDRVLAGDIAAAMRLITEGALSGVWRALPGLPSLWNPARLPLSPTPPHHPGEHHDRQTNHPSRRRRRQRRALASTTPQARNHGRDRISGWTASRRSTLAKEAGLFRARLDVTIRRSREIVTSRSHRATPVRGDPVEDTDRLERQRHRDDADLQPKELRRRRHVRNPASLISV